MFLPVRNCASAFGRRVNETKKFNMYPGLGSTKFRTSVVPIKGALKNFLRRLRDLPQRTRFFWSVRDNDFVYRTEGGKRNTCA